MAQLGEMQGLEPLHIDDVRTLPDAGIRNARVLALFTIGETPWSPSQRARDRRPGARRRTVDRRHPLRHRLLLRVGRLRRAGRRSLRRPSVDADRSPPTCSTPTILRACTSAMRGEWHDEVYQFRDLRPDAHVLLAVRDGELDLGVPGARPPSFGYPLAWCFTEGAGRVFSTSLGHFPEAWESPSTSAISRVGSSGCSRRSGSLAERVLRQREMGFDESDVGLGVAVGGQCPELVGSAPAVERRARPPTVRRAVSNRRRRRGCATSDRRAAPTSAPSPASHAESATNSNANVTTASTSIASWSGRSSAARMSCSCTATSANIRAPGPCIIGSIVPSSACHSSTSACMSVS